MSSLSDTSGDVAAAVGKSTFPVVVSAASFLGWSFQDWVYLVTFIYTALQIYLVVRKVLKEHRKK